MEWCAAPVEIEITDIAAGDPSATVPEHILIIAEVGGIHRNVRRYAPASPIGAVDR